MEIPRLTPPACATGPAAMAPMTSAAASIAYFMAVPVDDVNVVEAIVSDPGWRL
jgi:hypothetical protein